MKRVALVPSRGLGLHLGNWDAIYELLLTRSSSGKGRPGRCGPEPSVPRETRPIGLGEGPATLFMWMIHLFFQIRKQL